MCVECMMWEMGGALRRDLCTPAPDMLKMPLHLTLLRLWLLPPASRESWAHVMPPRQPKGQQLWESGGGRPWLAPPLVLILGTPLAGYAAQAVGPVGWGGNFEALSSSGGLRNFRARQLASGSRPQVVGAFGHVWSAPNIGSPQGRLN